MSRPQGSKNKPKNAKQLLDAVVTEYKKHGKNLSFELSDIENLTEEQKAKIADTAKNNPDINIPLEFELENPEDEEDETFKCGNCGAELEGEDSSCPYCGIPLSW